MIHSYQKCWVLATALAIGSTIAPPLLAQHTAAHGSLAEYKTGTPSLQHTPQAAGPMSVNAPLGYSADNAINTAGTYTDLGTTGRAISVGLDTDNGTSAPQDIGFPFVFRGVAFTKFTLNSNGFIKLGSAQPSRNDLYFEEAQSYNGGVINSTAAADSNIIAVLNHNLGPASSGPQPQFRILTSGMAPNRVSTIQWKNMIDMPYPNLTPVWSKMDFQIKLYETTNWIEFVYGEFLTPLSAVNNWKGYGVGLRGSSNQPSQLLIASHFSESPWTSTTFSNITTYQSSNGNQHNVRPVLPPDMGRTYRFTRPLAKNVRAREIVGLPQFRTCTNVPDDTLGIVVTNTGTQTQTNVPVTLEIDGVRRNFTLPSLAADQADTVYYGPVNFSAAGRYFIRAWTSLPGDMVPQNDSVRADTVVTLIPNSPGLTPDTNSFESTRDRDGWLIFFTGNRTNTWTIFSNDTGRARSGGTYWMAPRTAAARPAETLISSCLNLDSGKIYGIGFSYATQGQARLQRLGLYLLQTQAPDTTQPLWGRLLDQGNVVYRDTIILFEANRSGLHYFGWRLFGAAANSQVYLDRIFFKEDTGVFVANRPVVKTNAFVLAPNPARDRISLRGASLPKGDCYALAADGRRIRLEVVASEADERTFRIAGLRPGVYTLTSREGRRLGRFAVAGD